MTSNVNMTMGCSSEVIITSMRKEGRETLQRD